MLLMWAIGLLQPPAYWWHGLMLFHQRLPKACTRLAAFPTSSAKVSRRWGQCLYSNSGNWDPAQFLLVTSRTPCLPQGLELWSPNWPGACWSATMDNLHGSKRKVQYQTGSPQVFSVFHTCMCTHVLARTLWGVLTSERSMNTWELWIWRRVATPACFPIQELSVQLGPLWGSVLAHVWTKDLIQTLCLPRDEPLISHLVVTLSDRLSLRIVGHVTVYII